MKVLVLGATGLLGREVLRRLRDCGLDVIGAGRRRACGDILGMDMRDPQAVDALFEAVETDVVVNAVGERRPEHWGGQQLYGMNVALPRLIAERCEAKGAWLIHVSSDYVFDGRRPPHAPDDRRRPLNGYGRSKADGEDAIRRTLPSATILRVPVLHGRVEFAAESNLSSLVPLVTAGTPATVDDWAVRYPTATRDVATVLGQMLAHAGVLRGRTWHWSGTEAATKYEMALAIGDVLDLPTDHLRPERRPDPTRPRDPQLDCRMLEGLGFGARTPLRAALPEVIACALGRAVTP
jgi:dTDP-4-dehydrorhamnose reductase